MNNLEIVSVMLIGISLILIIGSIVLLKRKKNLSEKALMYGFLSALAVQFFSLLLASDGSTYFIILNSLFFATISYNMVYLFGIRMAKIHEKSASFFSYFVGFGVIGNLLNLLLMGVSSLLFLRISGDSEMVAQIGVEFVDAFTKTFNYVLLENLPLLIMMSVVAIFINYISLHLFNLSFTQKNIITNLKGVLVLFIYYCVSFYIPSDQMQSVLQLAMFVMVSLAGYWILKEVKQVDVNNEKMDK